MIDTATAITEQRHGLLIRLIGALLLLAGLAAAYIAPIEIYTYYAFAPGGRFSYEGFNFGSFMFAYITIQVAGYYLIAALGITLGYGHLARTRWARPLTVTGLWFWLVCGLPLMVIALLMLVTSKGVTVTGLLIGLPFMALAYPVGPILLLRFYQSEPVREVFEQHQPTALQLDTIPLSVRGVCALLCFIILALHLPMLVNGIFPLFGRLLTGRQGFVALDILILTLAGLTWGFAQQKRWAWIGVLLIFGLLAASNAATFARHSLLDVLLVMRLPPTEMAFFQGIPFLEQPLALPTALPSAGIVILTLASGRHFCRGHFWEKRARARHPGQ
jgi:hypothetical protein